MQFNKYILILGFLAILANTSLASEDEKKLRASLLKNYDKNVRPVKDNSATVTVKSNLHLIDASDFDAVNNRIKVSLWYQMAWTDKSLTWDPAVYGNIKTIRINIADIWAPDVVSYHLQQPYATRKGLAVLYNTGDILFITTTQTNSIKCEDLEGKYFPYDRMKCGFIFGSWTYDESQVNLTLDSSKVETEFFMKNHEWDLKSTQAVRIAKKYDCCSELYPHIKYSLTFKRNPSALCSTVVLPTILSVLITLALLVTPIKGEVKFLASGLIFTADLGLLIYISSVVGSLSTVPFVSNVLAVNMVLVLVVAVFLRNCASPEFASNGYKECKQS